LILEIVKVLVSLLTAVVIACFFHHCDRNDEGQRSRVSDDQANLQERDELGHGDKQEEHVEEELELVE
jgi:hypothetical protein